MKRKIKAVKFQVMYNAVQSKVILEYYENNSYSFCIEYGTIEKLCDKYEIKKIADNHYDVCHLVNKACELDVKDGNTIFLKYY
jgi:hypothetical protein